MIETNEADVLEALEVLNIAESVSAFMSCVHVGKIQRHVYANHLQQFLKDVLKVRDNAACFTNITEVMQRTIKDNNLNHVAAPVDVVYGGATYSIWLLLSNHMFYIREVLCGDQPIDFKNITFYQPEHKHFQ